MNRRGLVRCGVGERETPLGEKIKMEKKRNIYNAFLYNFNFIICVFDWDGEINYQRSPNQTGQTDLTRLVLTMVNYVISSLFYYLIHGLDYF